MRLTLVFLAILLLTNCKKSTEPEHFLTGTYTGSFIRHIEETGDTAHVQLSFTGNKFNGTSDSSRYPMLCAGTYTLPADSIDFINACDLQPGSDLSLLLQGSYKLVQILDSLYIRRIMGDFAYEEDVYSLRKQLTY